MRRRAPDPWLGSQVRTQSRRREGGWALDCSSRTRSYAGESARTIPQCIASRCGGAVEIGPEPLVSLAPRAGPPLVNNIKVLDGQTAVTAHSGAKGHFRALSNRTPQ